MTAASQTPLPNLAIVGAGRVGSSLHAAATAAGLDAILTGRERVPRALTGADVVLICTPDAEIAGAGAALAGEIAATAIAGHTSGATPLASLAPLAERCAGVFGLHPLQTIPGPRTPLAAIPCALSASDPATTERARNLAALLGMEPFAIDEADRAAYHAAASMASNFLFALEESAASLMARAGARPARRILAPLVRTSAGNWAEHGTAALTGPIARGDEATIERHREAISERAPELLPLYDALAERTRHLARPPEPVG